jgi:hypothetical protein
LTGRETDADNPCNDDAKDEEEFYAKSPPRNDKTNELKDQPLADIYWVLDEIIMFFCTGIILAELTFFSFLGSLIHSDHWTWTYRP